MCVSSVQVRYGEEEWKDRYYAQKLKVEGAEGRAAVCEEYVRGLCWVLKYYYQVGLTYIYIERVREREREREREMYVGGCKYTHCASMFEASAGRVSMITRSASRIHIFVYMCVYT